MQSYLGKKVVKLKINELSVPEQLLEVLHELKSLAILGFTAEVLHLQLQKISLQQITIAK